MITRDLEAAVERALVRWLAAHSRLDEARRKLTELEDEIKSLEETEQNSQDQVRNSLKKDDGSCYPELTYVSGSKILIAGQIGIRMESAKILDIRTP